MFTGIIEALGKVTRIAQEGTNRHFQIQSEISRELKVDQSLSHNGVCLTVTKLEEGKHWVTAVKETLDKSNLGELEVGSMVNLERSMLNNGRFDGHIVQGHVDTTAVVKLIKDEGGSWRFDFEHAKDKGFVTVEKGSICVNGISLTCFGCSDNSFSVAIIPVTYTHTNLNEVKVGDRVNLEFDILGKYIQRLLGGRA
ncbi:MAG: riboflavin synthase [Cyclobacteriaceae bacterium]|nr:riboflavin synthase [Cyclobacteriaceae bacterium]